MYRGRANAVVYFFLCLSILIIGILVYKQIQFSYALRESVAGSDGSYFSVKALKDILSFNQVSLRTFFFTFVCFLVVLVSLLIVLQSTEKAYKLTNEANVRYTIKMTYPGIVLAVIGCFFLALSIYRSSDLQINASNRMVDQKKYQIVLDSLFEEKMMLEQGITELKQQPAKKHLAAVKPGAQKTAKSSAPKPVIVGSPVPVSKPVAVEPKTPARQPSKSQPDISSIVGQLPAASPAGKNSKKAKEAVKQPVAVKEAKPKAAKEDKVAARKTDTSKAAKVAVAAVKPAKEDKTKVAVTAVKPAKEDKAKVAAVAATVAKEDKKEPQDANTAVSPQELQYAKQLQREATIYGHYPSSSELNAYNSIYKRLQKRRAEGDASASGKAVFNSDLHWAFALLQKTKSGYQPTPEELVRYEQTVQRNLDISETFEGRLR